MKGSSLGAIALAASLTTGSVLAQKSISQMTKEEIHAEIISLCMDEKRMSNIIDPDKVCEYTLDNGKTWKEYIPSIPDGTAGIAGGIAGGLLALLATGAAIMRFRKKDEYTISPDLIKKYVPPAKPKVDTSSINVSGASGFPDTKSIEDHMLAQAKEAIPEYRGLDHAMRQENAGMITLPPFSQIETPVHQVDILLDGDREKNTELPLLTESTVRDNVEKGAGVSELIIENTRGVEVVIESSVNSVNPTPNIIQKDAILEALQGGTLDKEGKKKLNDSLPQLNPYKRVYLPQKNAAGRYGFTISEDENGALSIRKDKKTGFIYSLNTTGKIQETEEYSLIGVKAVQVLDNGYLQFIVGNDFERKIILLSKEKISLN